MIIFFMRNGKGLGTLNWKTDHIYLMKSSSEPITREDREKMECGHYISSSKDPETGKCMCNYCTGKNKWLRTKISNALRKMMRCVFVDPKI